MHLLSAGVQKECYDGYLWFENVNLGDDEKGVEGRYQMGKDGGRELRRTRAEHN